ncbi:MAG TPA: DoxX family protein [Kineosporiaceae bacterium]
MSASVDLGVMLIRLALGPMLVLHGLNKIFGAGGLAGTTRWFESLGLRPARLHARTAAVSEIAAGAAMTMGLLTPLACAAFVGLMTVASFTDHRGKGYFVFKGGWEYTLLVAVTSVGVAALGPGAWSLDQAFGWVHRGPAVAVGVAVVGVLSAAGLLAVSYRPQGAPAP